MKIRVVLCVFLLGLQITLFSQSVTPAIGSRSFGYFGAAAGLWNYKGDVGKSRFSASPANYSVYAGFAYRWLLTEVNFQTGKIIWNGNSDYFPSNFNADISCLDLRLKYRILRNSDFSPFIGAGIGHCWFSSFSDLKDANGISYTYWSDGTIRDIPETPLNFLAAKNLERDYTYESALAIDQTALCFPLIAGIDARISERLQFNFGFELLLLQSDNIDRNVSTAGWDRFERVSAGLTFRFGGLSQKPVKSKKPVVPAAKVIDYSGVDVESILYEDEDKDGVTDMNDACFGTSPGAIVDEKGCTSDTDEDGVADYLDKEPATAKASWVNKDGVALSDDQILRHYNDSISYMVKVLRKFNKNSRPYPVRKYIPKENLEKYALMLEQHPEWRTDYTTKFTPMPAEFKSIDINHDNFISVSELQRTANLLFEGKAGSITSEILQKAILYAFEEQ